MKKLNTNSKKFVCPSCGEVGDIQNTPDRFQDKFYGAVCWEKSCGFTVTLKHKQGNKTKLIEMLNKLCEGENETLDTTRV